MPHQRLGSLTALVLIIFVAGSTSLLFGANLLPALAAPLGQFPTNSVTIVSDPPPPDLPGQFSERTLLRPNLLDPDPLWREPVFDDSSWQDSYAAARLPAWGDPLGNPASAADFIWGGPPGAGPDANGRFEIATTPAPQFLFLRKNFCIPLNADPNSIAAAGPLTLEVAATPGGASVYYNGPAIATGLPGDETNNPTNLTLDPLTVAAVRRVGRNTLALRIRDDVNDPNAGVAYSLDFSYTIDAAAITPNASPPSPGTVNTPVTFDQTNNGLSGDTPYTFAWDLGNGATSSDPTPTVTYTTPGTYTVVLTMTDRFGCPSAPVTLDYIVEAQAQVSFSSPTYTVAESDGLAIITVRLDAPAAQTVTVDYAASDGTATAGSDYTADSNTLTFAPGVISQTFSLPILSDSLAEPDETVILTLSNALDAVIVDPNPATLIILGQTAPPGAGDSPDADDDDDDASSPPPPPPPLPATPPAPAPTEVADFPLTLPETGLMSPSTQPTAADSSQVGLAVNWLAVISVSLLVAGIGYYLIRYQRD